jgi:hypothetical protein
MTSENPLFTPVTIDGREHLVGRLFKRIAKTYGRDGTQAVKYCFIVRCGSMIETFTFDNEEAATMAREALVGKPAPDTDARDRVVMDLLSNHLRAKISPQPDASVIITAYEPEATYHIHADGTILEAGLAA